MAIDSNLPQEEVAEPPEALLRAAFETVGEAILSINSDSIIVMANPEIERIFGYRPEELLGRHLHTIMPEEYRQRHAAGLQRYLATGVASVLGIRLELEGLKKDGSLFPLELRITPTFVDNQYFFTASIRDITQQRESEHRVKEQQVELVHQNRQLASINHFFLFTLQTMESVLARGATNTELLAYIAQVKSEFVKIEKDTRIVN
ncbi:MAG: PAS domain S-box protein [Chloroflexi bacterium]|nr:PAS domain S-box protein [Chloroflexota bacterium]MCI0645331.1 PAS domain S-box protein [Chloroflexota bacterium]MCI0727486.1 PAS domain S-box protein [Chloroflexota bacterium]